MNRTALLITLLALAGCEADAEKLTRLESDRDMECRLADSADRVAENLPQDEQAAERWRNAAEARTACTLAQRELNRFLQ